MQDDTDSTHIRIKSVYLSKLRDMAQHNGTTVTRQLELALCKHLDIRPPEAKQAGAHFFKRSRLVLNFLARPQQDGEIRVRDIAWLLKVGTHQARATLSRMVDLGLLSSEIEDGCGGRIVYRKAKPPRRADPGDIPPVGVVG